jgi:hypothetical protein
MKHLVLVTLLLMVMYFAWSYTPSKDKSVIKRFLSKHLPMVAFIMSTIIVLLVVQLNLVSIAIL